MLQGTIHSCYGVKIMAQVELNTPAPEFTLADYTGQQISLSAYKGKQSVLLVFNRGFI